MTFTQATCETPGVLDNRFLADVADEHILMENRAAVSRCARTMRPTTALGDTGGNYLQSIIQRPGQSAWEWDDGGGQAIPLWAARAISETLGEADLRVLPDPYDETTGVLYRRVMPDHLTDRAEVRWKPVTTLRAAYGGRRSEELAGFDSFIIDALLRSGRIIRRACSFLCTDGELRFEYDPRDERWYMTTVDTDGHAYTTTQGRKTVSSHMKTESDGKEQWERVQVEPRDVSMPATYAVDTGMPMAQAMNLSIRAGNILYDWTGRDTAGWTNLKLSLTAAFLRSHAEKAYCWQGPGGTGKSTLATDLLRHMGDQATTLSFDLLGQPTSMSAENSMFDLTQNLLALTDDYDPRHGRFEKILPSLKVLLTGLLPFGARRQGENRVDARPQCVHLVTTNYHLPLGGDDAEQRRFAFSTLSERRVLWDEYRPFRKEHGFWPFMLASAVTWVKRQGLHCHGSAYVSEDGLGDEDVDAIREILVNGFAVPHAGQHVHWKAIGAKRSTSRKGFDDGRSHSVWRASVEGDPLYDVWEASRRAVESLDSVDAAPVDPPDGDRLSGRPDVDDWTRMLTVAGAEPRIFPCHTGQEKDPRNPEHALPAKSPHTDRLRRLYGTSSWKKAVSDPALDLSHRTDPDWPCWGMTVNPDHVWLDLDRHSDGPAGWELLQEQTGPYGSPELPRTFAVRTPSGGIHLLYRIPDGLKLKSRANADTQVDLRVGGAGYVVAGGSRTTAGGYQPIDEPDDPTRVPLLTPVLVEWLESNDYVDRPTPPLLSAPPGATPPANDDGGGTDNGGSGGGSDGNPMPDRPPFAGMDGGRPYESTYHTRPTQNNGIPVPGTNVRIDPPGMGRNATHDPWRDWCYGIAMRAVENHWDADTLRRVFTEGMRRVPAEHDRRDTIRCIQDACEKAGISPPPLE